MDIEMISIDLETTNLDVDSGEIVQIGVILFNLIKEEKWTWKETNRYASYLRYVHPETLSKESMSVNKIPRSVLEKAPLPHIVKDELIEWWEEQLHARKLLPIGHNYGGFDKGFLNTFLGQYYDDMFDYHSFDTWTLAKTCQILGHIPEEVSLSLAPLTEYFNICRLDHNAIPDALNTVEVLVKLLNLLDKNE